MRRSNHRAWRHGVHGSGRGRGTRAARSAALAQQGHEGGTARQRGGADVGRRVARAFAPPHAAQPRVLRMEFAAPAACRRALRCGARRAAAAGPRSPARARSRRRLDRAPGVRAASAASNQSSLASASTRSVLSSAQRGGERERKVAADAVDAGHQHARATPSGVSKPGASQKRRTGATMYSASHSSSPSDSRACHQLVLQPGIPARRSTRRATGAMRSRPAPASCRTSLRAQPDAAPALRSKPARTLELLQLGPQRSPARPCGLVASSRALRPSTSNTSTARFDDDARLDAHTVEQPQQGPRPLECVFRAGRAAGRGGLQLNAAGARSRPMSVCGMRLSRAKRKLWPSMSISSAPMPGSSSSRRNSMRTPNCRPPSRKNAWRMLVRALERQQRVAHLGLRQCAHGPRPHARVDPRRERALEPAVEHTAAAKGAHELLARHLLRGLAHERIAAIDGLRASRHHVAGELAAPGLAQRSERQAGVVLGQLLQQCTQRLGRACRRGGEVAQTIDRRRRGLARHRIVDAGQLCRHTAQRRMHRLADPAAGQAHTRAVRSAARPRARSATAAALGQQRAHVAQHRRQHRDQRRIGTRQQLGLFRRRNERCRLVAGAGRAPAHPRRAGVPSSPGDSIDSTSRARAAASVNAVSGAPPSTQGASRSSWRTVSATRACSGAWAPRAYNALTPASTGAPLARDSTFCAASERRRVDRQRRRPLVGVALVQAREHALGQRHRRHLLARARHEFCIGPRRRTDLAAAEQAIEVLAQGLARAGVAQARPARHPSRPASRRATPRHRSGCRRTASGRPSSAS